jgi:hypothetical protein
MLKPLTEVERRKALSRAIFVADENTFYIMEGMLRICQNAIIREATGEDPNELFTDTKRAMADVLEEYLPTKGKR